MPRILGIDLVPLIVPLRRRLEMFVVCTHLFIYGVTPLLSMAILFFTFFYTPYWCLSLGYLTWMVYDICIRKTSSRGGRRWEWLRNSYYKNYLRDYFPISLEKTCDLDPKHNYIFGYHPHGILGCGAFCNFASNATGFSEKFPGITPHLITLKAMFTLPFSREYTLWNGICDASKESIEWITDHQGVGGNAAVIVIGGAAEALEAKPGKFNLQLQSRKGFIKIAITKGAWLVPVFSFGENDLYQQAYNERGTTLRRIQDLFKNIMGISPPFFYGRGMFNYTFGLIPFRHAVVSIVGEPIPVKRNENPSQEHIDELHQRYMNELSDLFDKHKSRFDISEDKKLHFI